VDGIIEEAGIGDNQQLNAQLGIPVTPFDFKSFYANLGQTFGGGDPALLQYNSFNIQDDNSVKASTLYALRAEAKKAVLNKAVITRQNAFYAKYANQAAIIEKMRTFYSGAIGSKQGLLGELSGLAQNQANSLKFAYKALNKDGVVETTTSVLKSVEDDADKKLTGSVTQTIQNTDYGFRMPLIESQAQNSRAQISLMDEQFAAFIYGQNLPNLEIVFANELASIDLDVRRLQVDYLNTILMSPIAGIVTGIYKNVGDWVKAGEPVVRVEDNRTAILVATLKYPGLISIGSTVTVQTHLFDSPSTIPAGPTTAKVVAVRGHRDEDDRWDVLVNFPNVDASGNAILPLGYNFDYDDTSVNIT